MVRGIAGGIGESLIAGGAQYEASRREREERDRRRSIENKALAQQEEAYNWQKTQRDQSDAALAANFETVADENFSPAAQVAQLAQQPILPSSAAPTTQAQPGAAAPPAPSQGGIAQRPGAPTIQGPLMPAKPGGVAPRGLVVPGSPLAQATQVQAAQAEHPPQMPLAGGAQQTPLPAMEPELAALHQNYVGFQNQFKDVAARIDASTQDPVKRRQMRAAYMRTMEENPRFKSMREGMESYTQRVIQKRNFDKATVIANGVISGDETKVSTLFGKPMKFGKDPLTGLQGFFSPEGAFVGADVAVAHSLYQAGAIDSKKFEEMTKAAAKDYIDVVKAKTALEGREYAADQALAGKQISIHLAQQKAEKPPADIRIAEQIARDVEADFKKSNPNATKDEIDAAGRAARLEYLGVKVEKVKLQGKAIELRHAEALDKMKQQEVAKEVTASKGDIMKGQPPVSQSQANAIFQRLTKKDPEMGITYMYNLTPELSAGVQKFAQSMQPGSSPTGKRTDLGKPPSGSSPNMDTLGKNPRHPKAVWSPDDQRWVEKQNGKLVTVE